MMSSTVRWVGGLLQSILILLLQVVVPVLRPDDHYLLRYYAAINRVVQPVMHRIFMVLRPQNGKTIKEQLFDIPGYSNSIYKKTFGEGEKRKLDNNNPSDEFDISFLYKLLQLLCGLAISSNPNWNTKGSLENSLKRLKDHRNTFAHEDISLTSDILQQKVKDMEDTCRSVLEAAGLREQVDLTADIAEMEARMKDVLQGGIDLWEPYRGALQRLRIEQTSVLLREGRKDIKVLGKKLRILNPFAWLLDSRYSHLNVENVFTDIEMKADNKIEIKELLTTVLPSGELPDTIVISGPIGIGKTSLVRFLIQDWLSPNPTVFGMENIDLVLPVELRHVFSHDVKDLVKGEILRSVSQHLETDDMMSAMNDVSVLWLLDGYDEANLETRNVIKGILKKFPNSRVLITTRTEYRSEIELFMNQLHLNHLSVDLIGFSRNNIEVCARKLIAASVTNENEKARILNDFVRFMLNKNRLQLEIFCIPLYVTIIVLLWLDSPGRLSFVKTRSALYNQLVEHIMNRLVTRDSYARLGVNKIMLQTKINRFLDCLGKLFFKKESEYGFSLQQYEVNFLMNICSELGIPFKDTMSAFFTFSERATPAGVKEEYTVIHQTMMDFLIARSFCNRMISNNWDVMTTAEDWFIGIKGALLQHEPTNPDLQTKYNLDDLSKEMPYDIFQGICDKKVVMSVNQFFSPGYRCSACDTIRRRYIEFARKSKNAKNLWCHVKDHIFGPWTVYLVGYLNLRQKLSEARCEQLAFIYFKFVELHYGDFTILNFFIKEADCELFNSMLFRYVANFPWAFNADFTNVQSKEFLNHSRELLRYVTPKSVFLHYCPPFGEQEQDPCSSVISSIKTFMEHPVEIHLDLRYFLTVPNPGIRLTKTCLELLGEPSSRCRLVNVRCPMDVEILRLLKKASHLRLLTVKLHGEDFSELNELVRSLPDLETVKVALDPSNYSRIELPVMVPENNSRSVVSIVLTDVFSLDPRYVGSAVGRLCSNPTCVVLQGSIIIINEVNLLAYIFWVVCNINTLCEIKIILDVSRNRDLLLRTKQINALISYAGKIYPDITIKIKFSIQNRKRSSQFRC